MHINRWVSLLFLLRDSRVSPWLISVSSVVLRTFDESFLRVSVLYFLLLLGTLVVLLRFPEVVFLLCDDGLLLRSDLVLKWLFCLQLCQVRWETIHHYNIVWFCIFVICFNIIFLYCCHCRSYHSLCVVWNLVKISARKVMMLFADFTSTTNEIR